MKSCNYSVCLVFFLFFFPGDIHAKLYYWNQERLDSIRAFALNHAVVHECIKYADSYVDKKPLVVTTKKKHFSGDKHNLEGIPPYFWREKNNGKYQWVGHDGHVNPEIKSYDNNKIYELETRLRTLSIAYFLTNDNRYFKAYIKQIKAWFINRRTMMNPNFDYAQFIPGRSILKGEAGGIIEAYALNGIIESYRLVYSVTRIDTRVDVVIKKWFAQLAAWMTTSENGILESRTNNNHSIAYYEDLINIAIFVNDSILLRSSVDSISKKINEQIDDIGFQKNELSRVAAFDYSVYNLTHIIDACLMAKNAGYDLYNPNSTKIERAAILLLDYVNNKKTFPYGNKKISDLRSIRVQCNRLLRLNPKADFTRYNPLTSNYYFVQ